MAGKKHDQAEVALWLEKNIHRITNPVMSREAYFGLLTEIYYRATKSHWDSELAAECHVDFALDGHVDLTFTEFQILKSCNTAVWHLKQRLKVERQVA